MLKLNHNKVKKLKALLALLCIAVCVSAQVPQKIAYQAVLRNGDGAVIANEDVVVRIGLLQGSVSGSVVYSEQHEVTTSAQGVISLAIGDGTPDSDDFQFWNVPWNTEIFIKIEVKRDGSSDFVAMEPNRVLSVPYSFRAQDALRADTVQYATSASAAKSVQGAVVLQPNKSHKEESPIFVVRNSAGEVVFSVYDEGLRAFVGNSAETGGFVVKGQDATTNGYFVVSPDSTRVYANNATKGPRSGFAVGGRAGQKTTNQTYFAVSPYLTEVYFDTTKTKGPRSGFAVGGRAGQKGESNNYLTVTPAITEVNFDSDAAKGPRSGFAVGGRAGQKAEPVDYLTISPISTNIYVDNSTKGPRSGFAVGGRAGQKGEENSYLFVNPDSTRVYFDDTQKGPRSGFAVGGRAGQKGDLIDLINVSSTGTSILTQLSGNEDDGMMGGFDVGGVTSTTPTYTSYFSVTPSIITIAPTIISTGGVEITGEVVENYDPTDVQDGAGNWYKTVQIGNNRWFKSNLRTTKYSDGTNIEESLYSMTDTANIDVVGLYYNYRYESNSKNICPEGWHVSTLEDWLNARDFFISQGISEDEILNNIALNGYWDNNPNVVPVDTFGFSMPAAGYYSYASGLVDAGKSAIYWLGGFNESGNVMIFSDSVASGYQYTHALNSVRCVMGYFPLVVRTEYYDSIQTNSATLYGMIMVKGESEIIEKGFCYGLSANPSFDDNKVVSTDSFEYFTAKVTDLEAATSYYYRAYAIDAVDTAFGESMTFRTQSVVTELSVDSISDVTYDSARAFASVYGVDVITSGLCYSTTDTIALDSETTYTLYNEYQITGIFEFNLYDLLQAAVYNVCAFAITETDTIYSEIVQFETLFNTPSATIDGEVSFPAQGMAMMTLLLEGNFTNVISAGVCYGTSEIPGLTDSTVYAASLDGAAKIVLENLKSLTTYYARSFLITAIDTTFGDQIQFTTDAEPANIVLNQVDVITSNSAILTGVLYGEPEYNLSIGIRYTSMTSEELADTLFMDAHFVGEFEAVLEGLSPETDYQARAFVITSIDGIIDTTLGNFAYFTTKADSTINKGDVFLRSQEEVDQFVARGIRTIEGNLIIGDVSTVDTLGESMGEALGYHSMGMVKIANIDTLELTSVTGFVMIMGVEENDTTINFYSNIGNIDTLVIANCTSNTTIDVSKNSQLRYLSCFASNINSLDLSGNSALEYLNCSSNMLEELNVSNCSNLTELICSECEMLSNLDLSGNPALRVIDCSRNQITNLDFSANTNLTNVMCWENQLTTLDLSHCSQLMYLDCSMSQLSSLKLGTCNTLGTLMCQGNQLTRLNISDALKITTLACGNQQADFDLILFTNEVGRLALEADPQMNAGVIACLNPVYFYQMSFTVENEVVNLFGNIAVSDTTLVSEMGVCYSSTTSSPTIDSCEVLTVRGEGDFSVSLNNLPPATTYTVREFATCEGITYYGDSTVFTTLNIAPTVNTLDVENTTGEYAVLHGEANGNNISRYGFCFSPYDSSLTLNTTDLVIDHTNSGLTELSFSDTLVLEFPMYYVRAFAVNEIDTAYGQVVNFIPVMLPELDSVKVDSVTANSAFFSAKIISDGGLKITERGFNITYQNVQMPAGEVLNLPSADTTDVFTASYSEFVPGSFYFVSAYAKNSIGEVSSQDIEFNTLTFPGIEVMYIDITAHVTDTSIIVRGASSYGNAADSTIFDWGFCYGTEPDPTINGLHVSCKNDTCSYFDTTLTGLEPGTLYYIRAYSDSYAGLCYSNNSTVKTHSLPSIKSYKVVKNPETFMVNMTLEIDNGGLNIDSCGVETFNMVYFSKSGQLYSDTVVLAQNSVTNNAFDLSFPYETWNGIIYFKHFVANKIGIVNGELDSIMIVSDLSVRTVEAIDVSYTKATLVGEINYDIASISAGVSYGLNRSNLSDSIVFNTTCSDYQNSLSSLISDTTYYFSYFAKLGNTRVAGDTLSFKTLGYGISPADGSGNTYKTVKIGDVEWFAQNLKTTNYSDGTPIPFVDVDTSWASLSSGAYCYSLGESTSVDSLGLLYNWYAVDTWNLCPEGWMVASQEQWDNLKTIAGTPAVLKEPGTWPDGWDDGTNDYLFSARQVNRREADGAYSAMNTPQRAYWWTSTLLWDIYPYVTSLTSEIGIDYDPEMKLGMSVRCARPLKTPVTKIDSVFNTTKTTATISGKTVFGGQISRMGLLILKLEINEDFSPTMDEYTYLYELDANSQNFNMEIASLTEATRYSVAIFTEVNGVISYSNGVTFKTECPPTEVKLVSIFDVNAVRANVSWTAFSFYEAEVIPLLGVCYGTDPDVSIENSKFEQVDNYEQGIMNSYNQTLVDLRPGQKYYVRAVFEENDSVYYSDLMEFTTDSIKYGTPITDSDNNVYQTIVIGEQEWMASNLRTTKQFDGTLIANITDQSWNTAQSAAYCWYNNEEVNAEPYGALYNNIAAINDSICPMFWHVANLNEYNELVGFLADNGYGFNRNNDWLTKALALNTLWDTSFTEGTTGYHEYLNNTTGLSIVPAGYRDNTSNFVYMGTNATLWTVDADTTLQTLSFGNEAQTISFGTADSQNGHSVRCIRTNVPTVDIDSMVYELDGTFTAYGHLLDNGTAETEEFGFIDDEGTSYKATSLDEQGYFVVEGISVAPNTKRYLRAFARNRFGMGISKRSLEYEVSA